MSTGKRKNEIDCLEVYQYSLEQRIQQGEWNLVCRDEELCKLFETCLYECNPKEFHSQLGVDTLSVIEVSLRATDQNMGQNRLKSLVKAFEVLELAALNLYLCPWRKEYKVVKMFSGMFTHCVKPALMPQQFRELFALLGYQPAEDNKEELRLKAKPVHSRVLLQMACGFFIARVECQLLLNAVGSLDGSMERVLQLIQERKCGCTFQIALDSAKRNLEPAPCDSPLALDLTLDLYTDSSLAGHGHMASPPSLLYVPPSEDPLQIKMSRSNRSQSNKERNEKKAQTVSISSMNFQINSMPQMADLSLSLGENERQSIASCNTQLSASNEQHACKSNDSHVNLSLQCGEMHSVDIPCLRSRSEQGHELSFAALSQTRQDQKQHWEKTTKDDLKQHSCIHKSSNDFFLVCHDCQYIHDITCEELETCWHSSHNVQNTGRIQQARVEGEVTAHTCFKADDLPNVVCHTCNKSHDLLCNELNSCIAVHNVSYLFKNNVTTSQVMPMTLHQCCTGILSQPKIACLTCRVFHTLSCDEQCQRLHEVQSLKSMCYMCADPNIFILCRYCCAQLCKDCWFKTPLECKCGMPFDSTAV